MFDVVTFTSGSIFFFHHNDFIGKIAKNVVITNCTVLLRIEFFAITNSARPDKCKNELLLSPHLDVKYLLK